MLGRAATKYFGLLNARAAANVVGRASRLGVSLAAKRGMGSGIISGASSFGRGIGRWAWPTQGASMGAQRLTRIGTAAGAGLLAGNFVNPRNNFGPF